MKDHNPFEDAPVRHESRLSRLHHSMRNLCEPIRPDLGKFFETNIKKTDGAELLDSHSLCLLRKQGYRSKIQLKKVKLARE